MTASKELKVIIIGGGVGGLVLATWLRFYNHQVIIIEQKTKYLESNSAGGLNVTENAYHCLFALGLEREFLAIADPGRHYHFKNYRDGSAAKVDTKRRHAFVHRTDFLRLMNQKAIEAGVEIICDKFESIQDTAESISVTLQNGQVITGDLVVGSDGINSKVRDNIPAVKDIRAKRTGDGVILVDVPKQVMDKHPATAELYRTGEDPYHFYMAPERSLVSWTMKSRQSYHLQFCDFAYGNGEAYGEADTANTPFVTPLNNMTPFRKRWDDFEIAVRQLLQETEKCTMWRIAEVAELPTYSSESGRIVLLGDAAHAFEPFAGQGACMAIEDATVLAALLSRSSNVSQVAKAFYATRKPRIEAMRAIVKVNIADFGTSDKAKLAERDAAIEKGTGNRHSTEERLAFIQDYDALEEAAKYNFDNVQ